MIKRMMIMLLGIVLCFGVAIPAAADEIASLPKTTESVFLIGTNNKAYVSYPSTITPGPSGGVYGVTVSGGTFDRTEDYHASYNPNRSSDQTVDESYRNEYKILVAYDAYVDMNGGLGTVDFWPKELELGEDLTVDVDEEFKVTAEIRNAMDQLNTGCVAKYTWTVTPDAGVGAEVTTLPTTDPISGGMNGQKFKLSKSGWYTIECSATAVFTSTDKKGNIIETVELPLNFDEDAKYTIRVKVDPLSQDRPEAPSKPSEDANFDVNKTEGGQSLTRTIPNGANQTVLIYFKGVAKPFEVPLDNGKLKLEGEALKMFLEKRGVFQYSFAASADGKYAESDKVDADWSDMIAGNGVPIIVDGIQEEVMGDGGWIKITQHGGDLPMQYRRQAKDGTWLDTDPEWQTVTKDPQPIELPKNSSGITEEVTVYVRYTPDENRLDLPEVRCAVPAADGQEVTIVAKNGSVIQLSDPRFPNKIEDGKKVDNVYIVPVNSTFEFLLVPGKGYEAKSASADKGTVTYDKKTGKGTLTVIDDCTLTAKFSGIDSGGDFIPGIGDSTGTTGNQPATGVTGNIWGPLLGGTGGTTAQSGAQTVGGFSDVPKSAYFAEAVLWAVNNDITNGTSATTFSPNASCTRAQMVTFLWRQAGSPEPSATNNPFTDVTADQYYYKAVLWAVGKGITNGTSATTFSPNATVTRAQSVTFIWRNAGKPNAGTGKTFTDVAAGPYSDAITWAAARGVTQGTSATTFSPSNPCTRGQIVTFMYRAI